MRLGIQSGESEPLAVRLAWLTALRLGVLTLFLVLTTTIYPRAVPGGFSIRFVLWTVGVGYGIAAVYAVLLRRGQQLTALAFAQIISDQLLWTGLVYISGGADSGATSLYGLTCLSGAILLGARGGAIAAGVGFLSLLALTAGLVTRVVPAPPDQPPEAYAHTVAGVGYPLFVNLLAIVVVTLLAGYLAERLRTTGGRLEQANARAEQAERLASLGRLAAGLAHEIRNPLGSIAGSIELLRTAPGLTSEDQQLCDIITRETSRLNDLVGDMLDLSRPRPPEKASMNLGALARDVVTLSGKVGRGADVVVTYEGPDEVSAIADAAQMRQVVWNLVRNAIQASPSGERVVVRLRPAKEEVALEVSDRGSGIPAEARARLFDAYFTTRSQGAGIGLAVVKRIVDDHEFGIEVDSAEGQGTTFRVRIPTEKPSATAALDAVAQSA